MTSKNLSPNILQPAGFWGELGKCCCLLPLIIGLMIFCYVIYQLILH